MASPSAELRPGVCSGRTGLTLVRRGRGIAGHRCQPAESGKGNPPTPVRVLRTRARLADLADRGARRVSGRASGHPLIGYVRETLRSR